MLGPSQLLPLMISPNMKDLLELVILYQHVVQW